MKEGERYIKEKPSNHTDKWIEIMAIRGEWIMARRSYCAPFVTTVNGMEERIKLEDRFLKK